MSDEPKRLIPLDNLPPGWGRIIIQNNTNKDVPDEPIVKYFQPPLAMPADGTVPVVQLVDNLPEN